MKKLYLCYYSADSQICVISGTQAQAHEFQLLHCHIVRRQIYIFACALHSGVWFGFACFSAPGLIVFHQLCVGAFAAVKILQVPESPAYYIKRTHVRSSGETRVCLYVNLRTLLSAASVICKYTTAWYSWGFTLWGTLRAGLIFHMAARISEGFPVWLLLFLLALHLFYFELAAFHVVHKIWFIRVAMQSD